MLLDINKDKLPCPRLELRWVKVGNTWAKRECRYSLVIPLRSFDIRRTDVVSNPTEQTLEMGTTTVTGGKKPVFDDHVDTPFRDHTHSKWDQDSLGGNIPRIAVCGDLWSYVDAIGES